MRKYILTLIAAVVTLTCTAQTEVLRIRLADREVTFNIADIQEMSFDTLDEPADTTLFHSFKGYIIVSTQYFQNSYYGSDAELAVYKTSEGEFIVTFSDPTWGEGFFGHVQVGQSLSGEGTMSIASQQSGQVKEYEATISGPMTAPVITIPSLMGGTTIQFHVGEPPVAYQIVGNHVGLVSVTVGGQFGPYLHEDVTYKIVANEDGTVNLVMPQYELTGTVMGDLTVGGYTVSNIAYDEELGAFVRDYTGDGLSMHLIAVNDGTTTMDNDYELTKLGNVVIQPTSDGITIVNSFQPGNMPFPIVATFTSNSQ